MTREKVPGIRRMRCVVRHGGFILLCHSREGGNPVLNFIWHKFWIPAFVT
jgi:hypothetical protein